MRCFIHRLRIADAIDSGRALPVGTERHVGTCAGCRAEWETGRALVRGLADSTRDRNETIPVGLHGRMMHAVRAGHPVADPVAFVWRGWVPVGVVALCLLLAFGTQVFFHGGENGGVPAVAGGGGDGRSSLAQVSGLAPAVVSLAATTGQAMADPFAPEWLAIERSASTATRTVLAAALDRLPGMD